jgi:thiol-disulfide isomerase/thioredoxin
MKKYFPFTIIALSFCGFLALQLGMDYFHLHAGASKAVDQKTKAIEDLYSGMNVLTTKKSVFNAKQEKKPIVILNFWASWCLPCLKEFPSLVKFQNKYKEKVVVLGINGDQDDPEKSVLKIEKKYSLNFDSLLDPKDKLSDEFFVTAYPTSLVFFKGKLIYTSNKSHDFMDKDFLEIIENHLK